MMHTITIESDQITLPQEVVNKLRGKEIQFVEFQKGFYLKPVSSSSTYKIARGMLKNKGFSTDDYFKNKREDKELEK